MEGQNKKRGFSLVEAVIVILLLAIIVAIAIIAWPDKSIELSAVTNQVVSDIRYTQSLAMSENARYRFQYNGTSYAITDNANNNIVHHTTGNTGNITLPSPMTFVAYGPSSCASASGCIEFNGRGAPYACGGAALTTATNICLRAGSARTTITVQAQTGYTIKSGN